MALWWLLYTGEKRWGVGGFLWLFGYIFLIFFFILWVLFMFIMCSLNIISIPKIFVFTSGYIIFFQFSDFVVVAIVLQNTVLKLKLVGTL